MRPQLVLGHAGLERAPHRLDAGLAGGDRLLHRQHLVGVLDGAGPFHQLFAVGDGDALALQRMHRRRIELVDREALVAAAMLAHQVGDLLGEVADILAVPAAVGEIGVRESGAGLAEQLIPLAQMARAAVVEQDDRPFGRHIDVAAFVVQRPDLHVGDVGGVADVAGIEQQRPAIVALAQLPADPIQAVAPEAGAVDLAVVIGSHSGFSPAPTLGGALPACHMRNPQGRQASAANEGGATACGIGFLRRNQALRRAPDGASAFPTTPTRICRCRLSGCRD